MNKQVFHKTDIFYTYLYKSVIMFLHMLLFWTHQHTFYYGSFPFYVLSQFLQFPSSLEACHKALSFHDILQHMKHMSDRKSHLQTITRQMTISSHLSMRDARMVVAIADCCISLNLKTLSITDSSVDVVSMPQKEHQSFTTMPAAITSEPRLTVPACNTI